MQEGRSWITRRKRVRDWRVAARRNTHRHLDPSGGAPPLRHKPRPPASKGSFRKLHNILLFDKPHGPSLNQALQRVRHLFWADKAGHTGSPHPLATGLLPNSAFGEATKIACGLAPRAQGLGPPSRAWAW